MSDETHNLSIAGGEPGGSGRRRKATDRAVSAATKTARLGGEEPKFEEEAELGVGALDVDKVECEEWGR